MPSVTVDTEAEWLAVRERHIGGSEVACLFNWWAVPGHQPVACHIYEQPPSNSVFAGGLGFKSSYRLWMEKAGKIAPDSFEENDRVMAGKYLEPALAEWSRSKFEWNIRKVRRYIQHETVDGWGASLDYELVSDGQAPVEFKNIDSLVFRDEWALDDNKDISGVPMKYLLQLQHQIGAVDAKGGWIVPAVGGNRLYRGWFDRHEPTQAKLAEAITMFWRGIEAEAEPTWLADTDTCAKLHQHGAFPGTLDLSSDEEALDLVEQYMEAKEFADSAERELDHLKAALMRKVGDSTRARVDTWSISWPRIVRPAKVLPAKYFPDLTYRGGFKISKRKQT